MRASPKSRRMVSQDALGLRSARRAAPARARRSAGSGSWGVNRRRRLNEPPASRSISTRGRRKPTFRRRRAHRPVEVDADQVHALDADRRAGGAGLADLDVLGPAVALDWPPAGRRGTRCGSGCLRIAARQPGRDRNVRLIGLDGGIPDGDGQVGVEGGSRDRPLTSSVPPPGSPATAETPPAP